jgi:hypothetical protein
MLSPTLPALLPSLLLVGTGTVVQTGSLPGNGTGQLQDFELHQFDDQAGALVLESVTVELFTAVSGGGTSTTAGEPTHIEAHRSADVLLAGQPLVETEAIIDTTIANTAAFAFSVFDTDSAQTVLGTPSELAPWAGPGTITLTSFTLITVDEQPRNTVFFGAGGSSTYTMTYAYREAATGYCTAGTSASGCQAVLGGTGVASAAAGAGFVLTASAVEGAKDGLFFFGANGRQANPWGNGTSFQCVVPPVQRAGLLTGSGTSGLCDGQFSQDLNAYWTAKPAANPGAGATVQAQLWYRDPLSTSNQTTSLSDAVEFPVAP